MELEPQAPPQTPDVCEQCESTDLRHEEVRSAFWHDDRLVVVEGIPALVCARCREQYFDDVSIMLVDLLRGEGFPAEKATGELRVPVFSIRDRLPKDGTHEG